MKDSVKISLAGHPDLNVRVKMKPLEFEMGGEASLAVATGDIHLHVAEFPYSMAIPFLGRRVVMSAYGPFGIHIKPIEAQLKALGVAVRGVVGGEDAGCEIHTHGACKAEVDISGEIVERAVQAVAKKISKE
jgi:hypothetical protein